MGHFLTARLTKMKVEEFWIGIPPRAKNLFTDKFGTNFTLNWLPIGWFVKIKWEDSSSAEASDADSFSAKRWWARALVLVAWVTMNFILAWVIFSLLLWKGTAPLAVNYLIPTNYHSYFLPSLEESMESGYVKHEGVLLEPLSDGVAEKSGIAKGDILKKVDGVDILSIDQLIERIKLNTPMEFTLQRATDKSTYKVGIMPKNGKIQSYLRYSSFVVSSEYKQTFSFWNSLTKWLSETAILSRVTLDFLGKTLHDLIRPNTPEDREIAKEMIAWPIGMWAGIVQMVQIGVSFSTILLMIALLSINLWVLNILPFPALDGGRLVSTTLIACFWFLLKNKQKLHTFEQSIHALWMIFLIGLSLLVAFHDILKL